MPSTIQENSQGDSTLKVLSVEASGRGAKSVSRTLTQEVISALENRHGKIHLTRRDLSQQPPAFVDADWIDATFTPADQRSDQHKAALAASDVLVDELMNSGLVIIATPIYNFGVPASLKAWIDMIARAQLTFRYTENGPEGLLRNKRAILVVTSGGVALDSPMDFATPFLRQVLGFVGITDVEVIAADQLNVRGDAAIDSARRAINRMISGDKGDEPGKVAAA